MSLKFVVDLLHVSLSVLLADVEQLLPDSLLLCSGTLHMDS